MRFVSNERVKQTYINKILEQIKRRHFKKQFETIYIGGGTPNCLSDVLLNKLLHALNKYLAKKYEFTIECNPELLTKTQIAIFKQNNVNRVSIGAQTTNDKLLRQIKRKHTFMNVIEGITNLRKAQITNIAVDFIYGFNEMNTHDLKQAIIFIKKFKIPHVS
jgi:oxygen-independent coproporphyrinogen-3 oxidase